MAITNGHEHLLVGIKRRGIAVGQRSRVVLRHVASSRLGSALALENAY
jgi:hypothetical protein